MLFVAVTEAEEELSVHAAVHVTGGVTAAGVGAELAAPDGRGVVERPRWRAKALIKPRRWPARREGGHGRPIPILATPANLSYRRRRQPR